MLFKVPIQSNSFLSRRLRSCLVVAATLGLPFYALAQETAPDPQAITTEELSKLVGGPTLVNYVGTNVPANEAVQLLKSQVKSKSSRFPFNNQTETLKNISVNWKDMPFWEAASEVEYLADGRWLAFSNSLYFSQNRRAQGGNQQFEPGLEGLLGAETPFVKVVASSLTRSSTSKVIVGENEGEVKATPDQITLLMNTYLDPKLEARSVQVRQLKFQSKPNGPVAEGSSLFERTDFGGGGITAISQRHTFLPTGIAIAPKSRFFRISGVLHTVITANSETWKIPDLVAAGKVTRNIGGAPHSIEDAEIRNNRLTVNLTAARPEDQTSISSQSSDIGPLPIRVRDAQGRDLQSAGSRTNQSNGMMKIELSFNLKTQANEDAVGPYSLEWTVSTQERSYDVPFEFRDVLMP